MIKGPLSRNQHARQSTRKEWLQRLDRVAGDLNVLLVLVAIGLATLDATMLFSQRLLDRIPQVTRVVDVEAPSAK
jgi:hypothetical protein